MKAITLSAPLTAFFGKLPAILNGQKPYLSKVERMWLTAFQVAASRSARQLNEDESFTLSREALQRCYEKKRDGDYYYVLRACCNAHRNHLRGGRRRRQGRPVTKSYDPWAGVDARLDLDDALVRMGKVYPNYERAVRLRRHGHTFTEIAKALGVGDKRAERIVERAEGCLKRFLGEAYEDS